MDYKWLSLNENDPQIFLYKQHIVISFSLVNLEQFVKAGEWRILYPLDQVASSIFTYTDKTLISRIHKKIRIASIHIVGALNTWYLQGSCGLK